MKVGIINADIGNKDPKVYRHLRSIQQVIDSSAHIQEAFTTSISIGTSNDSAFVSVDASNAVVDMTNVLPGFWEVSFEFDLTVVGTADNTLATKTSFRSLDDAVTVKPVASTSRSGGATIGGVAGVSASITTPVVLLYVFEVTTPIARRIKLQKQNTTSTNVSTRAISNLSCKARRLLG